jgi:hypothetical protein
MDERLVVPIIGPDAVVIDGDDGLRPFTEYLARWVERGLGLAPGDKPASDLNDVACRFLQVPGATREDLYITVKEALDQNPVQPPEALRKLARIKAFKLYVTTGIDDLLRNAIDIERFRGRRRTQLFAYAPQKVGDLPASLASFTVPIVYHLHGRASLEPDYVVTEEDMLEFLHALQAFERRPQNLLDELKPRTQLIIGSGYSDWLARFFLRVAKSERLLDARFKTDVLAEDEATAAPLGPFLQNFSALTKLYPGGALAFVDELAERWDEYVLTHPQEEEPEPVDPDVVEHAIFISYASEDVEIARELMAALAAADLPGWLDLNELKGGDEWNRKIRSQIDRASIFVPLLTPNLLSNVRRYVRTEWSFAEATARNASEDLPFVMPLCVGDVSKTAPQIHDFIRRVHWITPGEGEGRFKGAVARLKEVFEKYMQAEEARA